MNFTGVLVSFFSFSGIDIVKVSFGSSVKRWVTVYLKSVYIMY